MRVRIVCYEDVDTWILGKFAIKLAEELERLSVKVDIEKKTDSSADINHHIIYCDYDGQKSSVDTVMITHIDTLHKVNLLKQQLKTAELGICMSSATMKQLASLGVPRNKLCYVLPAHDGLIMPRPIKIGITSKVHNDGRKRELLLEKLVQNVSPLDFSFSIMGAGWNSIVFSMQKRGFQVDYHDHFDYQKYIHLMPTFDYYLYLGNDEGSMGFIDALAAGVPTIVTPQGYHLDAVGGIVHPFETLEQLNDIFKELVCKRRQLSASVEQWTWSNYAVKHLQLWRYLLSKTVNLADREYNSNTNCSDGVASLLEYPDMGISKWDKLQYLKTVLFGSVKNYYHTFFYKKD